MNPKPGSEVLGGMGTILDLNPRLQAARQARVPERALVPDLACLAIANLRLALIPLLMVSEVIGAVTGEDRPQGR